MSRPCYDPAGANPNTMEIAAATPDRGPSRQPSVALDAGGAGRLADAGEVIAARDRHMVAGQRLGRFGILGDDCREDILVLQPAFAPARLVAHELAHQAQDVAPDIRLELNDQRIARDIVDE